MEIMLDDVLSVPRPGSIASAVASGTASGADLAEAPRPGGPLGLVEDLLREPRRFLARLDEGDAPTLVRSLLATIVVSAGVFGGVIGAYRGGRQVLYCAVKVPLVLLVTLVVCVPPFIAIVHAAGTRLSARGVVALTLGACARFGLVLAGLAPVLWLLHGWLWYHNVILAIVAAAAVAGVAAGALLFSGLSGRGGAGRLAGAAFVVVFALTGAQTSWLLRPFLVRPRTTYVPFVRALEGDLLGSVHKSARSAAGVYDEESP